MNQFAQETLWKVIGSFFIIVVWPAIIIIVTRWLSGRWFRGIKITGRWSGKDDHKGWTYDFTAYLFLQPSQHDKSDRDVMGFISWKLMASPDSNYLKIRPLHSTAYEIVSGTLTESGGNEILILHHCGTTDKRLIYPSRYEINMTGKRSRCSGKTRDVNIEDVNGTLEGSVNSR